MIPRLAAVAALLAAVIVAVAVLAGGPEGKRLIVEVDDARFLNPGAEVRIAGKAVGRVGDAEVTDGGRARLTLRITDDRAWPLPKGTQAAFRWASTIAFSNRYIALTPPQEAEQGMLAEGDRLRASDVTRTVEVDDIVRDFDADGRRNLRSTIAAAGTALEHAEAPFKRTLDTAPPAVEQADLILGDLGAVDDDLRTLVVSADRVVHAVRASDPEIGRLLQGAHSTFGALADRSADLEGVLRQLPGTLDDARATLTTADDTLTDADDVTQALAPGVAEIRRIAAPLNTTLNTLRQVGPDARATLASLRRATPQLNPLITRIGDIAPDLEQIGDEGQEALNCIRPYAPTIGNFFVVWNNFNNSGDDKETYFRAKAGLYPVPAGSPLSPEQVVEAMPGLDYGFPRPPGFEVNDPWFQPECNLGPETLDPAHDPEAAANRGNR